MREAVPLFILGTHEFGHYLTAQRRGVDVSLPYFIPAPTFLGTFGAFIKMKSIARYKGDLLEALKGEIREAVNLDRRSRVYIVYMLEGKMKGRFIFGRRKAAPWEGYGRLEEHEEDEADGQDS